MAKSDDEFDRLLAETEAAIQGRPSPPAERPAAAAPQRPPGRFETSLRVSAVSGTVAAAGVFAAFAVLPFLGAFSGAAGAFIATFVIALAQRVTRRR